MIKADDKYSRLAELDKRLLWHPYSSMVQPGPVWPVVGAAGTRIKLADGRELVDGMSSWWSAIHGYNHPHLNNAVTEQTSRFAHLMFGGLTHEPAVQLAERLIAMAPPGLAHLFLSDSGSVSVEVAIKMAIQYWQGCGQPKKTRMVSLRGGYHGDTWGAMSVSDPDTGMHELFRGMLAQQLFVPRPSCRFGDIWDTSAIAPLEALFEAESQNIAALILEPVVQGAGGMYFYHPEYLKRARELCDQYQILLVADEIATGFGRTGKMFGCNWADITPDIMCVGKALTGGYMTLAGTLCTAAVATGICNAEPGVFMHGPTFMANPLACAVALASLELLETEDWAANVNSIEAGLRVGLAPARELKAVSDVRVLGAIGVVELRQPVRLADVQSRFVERGVWVRPFGRLLYLMPPYISSTEDIELLTRALVEVTATL